MITIDFETVDYIALCPGYTDRLLHKENTYQTVMDEDLLSKIREPDQYYEDYIKRYGHGIHKHIIKEVTTKGGPELCFWLWGYTDNGLDSEREYKAEITDCPNYS